MCETIICLAQNFSRLLNKATGKSFQFFNDVVLRGLWISSILVACQTLSHPFRGSSTKSKTYLESAQLMLNLILHSTIPALFRGAKMKPCQLFYIDSIFANYIANLSKVLRYCINLSKIVLKIILLASLITRDIFPLHSAQLYYIEFL